MKKTFSIIFLLFILVTQAQQKCSYKICKDVVINKITFEKSRGIEFRKSYDKELMELSFSLEEQPLGKFKCFLIKRYGADIFNEKKPNENILEDDDSYFYELIEKYNKNKVEVEISYFYEIIEKLNSINTENISYNWNVADGITSSVKISAENYDVRLSDNWQDEKKADYYNLFESLWKKYK